MNDLERCLPDPLSLVTGAIEPHTHRFKLESPIWQCLWQLLTSALLRADELRVWHRLDRFGNLYWKAYDPATGRSASYGSDAEMRAWIEELRYCK